MMNSSTPWGLVLALVAVGSLAGCTGGPSDGADPQDPRDLQDVVLNAGGNDKLILQDGRPGETVRFRDDGDPHEMCGAGIPHLYWWISIWNRTGLAHYSEYDLARPLPAFSHEVALPPDPPYMLWGGTGCPEGYHIEFRGNDFIRTSTEPIRNPPDPLNRPQLIEDLNRSVEVVIPVGQTHGEGILSLQGMDHLINFGFLGGFIERSGTIYGNLTLVEPNGRPQVWTTFDALAGTDVSFHHQTVGINGEYRVVVDLSSPAVPGTVWRAQGDVDTFRPLVADYGFQVPFAVYDSDPAP